MATRSSTKAPVTAGHDSKLLALRRSFGKLPLFPKDLLYENGNHHPVPQTVPVDPAGFASMQPAASVNSGEQVIRSSGTSKTSADDSFSSPKAMSQIHAVFAIQSPPTASIPSATGHDVNPRPSDGGHEETVKASRQQNYRGGGISSESFFDHEDDEDEEENLNYSWKRRGGLVYDAVIRPFKYGANKLRRNRRGSNATTSTIDCESPVNPGGLSEEQAFWNGSVGNQDGCEYSPLLDYDVPRDRFGQELTYSCGTIRPGLKSRSSSAETIVAVPISSAIDWNAHTPKYGRIVRTPRYFDLGSTDLLGPPPMRSRYDSTESLTRELARSVTPQYFAPVQGLRFPLPPRCTPEEISELREEGSLKKESRNGQVTHGRKNDQIGGLNLVLNARENDFLERVAAALSHHRQSFTRPLGQRLSYSFSTPSLLFPANDLASNTGSVDP